MPITIQQRGLISEGSESPITVSAYDWLDDSDCDGVPDEVISTLQSVLEVGTTDLVIDRLQVNDSPMWVNKRCIPAGQSFTFWVTGQLAATREYRVRFNIRTDANRVEVQDILLDCE